MELHKHFLEQDLKQASIHYSCFKDCLKSVTDHVEKGDVELAKHRTQDMLLSLHELSKLSDKKYNQEKFQPLIRQMMQQGIDIEVVRMYFHD